MTDIVRAAIAAELALVQRVARVPSPPLGYGADLACASDLTSTMDVVDPMSTRALGEAIARRLDTPRGSIPDAPDFGMDLRGYLNRGVTTADLNRIADRIRSEVTQDDRVISARVSVAPSPNGSALTVSIAVVPADVRGRFELVLAVTSADVLIEELRG